MLVKKYICFRVPIQACASVMQYTVSYASVGTQHCSDSVQDILLIPCESCKDFNNMYE